MKKAVVSVFFLFIISLPTASFAAPIIPGTNINSIVPQPSNCPANDQGCVDAVKAGQGPGQGYTLCDLRTGANNVINFGVYLSVFVATLMFAYGGFLYVTGPTGGEEQIKKAHKVLTNAVMGVLIVLLAWLIVNLFLSVLTGGGVDLWVNSFKCDANPTTAALQDAQKPTPGTGNPGTGNGGVTGGAVVASAPECSAAAAASIAAYAATLNQPNSSLLPSAIRQNICKAAAAYVGQDTSGCAPACSTPNHPSGNGCAYAVNQVLTHAGIAPLGPGPTGSLDTSVTNAALSQGPNQRGTPIDQAQTMCGDVVISGNLVSNGHTGVCVNNGCTMVISNSSSKSAFSYCASPSFYGLSPVRFYRVNN